MNWWTKLGCLLTGWDKDLMKQCSSASRTQLSKYTSALIILMIIWGIVGYGFAERYIKLPWWGCVFTSMVFITIIIMVERQIILATHKNSRLALFRTIIAFAMAIIGSTIIDQVLFGDDIDKQMKSRIEEQTTALSEQRSHILDGQIAGLTAKLDSLNLMNDQMQKDVDKNPTIPLTTIRIETENLIVDGKIKKTSKPVKEIVEIANPKKEEIDNNKQSIAKIEENIKDAYEKKIDLEDNVRRECEDSVGFLEELEAMWSILSERTSAKIFYIILFAFLIGLELFILVSKSHKEECDYEKLVKYQLEVKKQQIDKLLRLNYQRI